MKTKLLGGFEQMVLLSITRLGNEAAALEVSRELEDCTGRPVSRGALYTTLHRLEKRQLVEWKLGPGEDARGGLPVRRFSVTARGLEVLRYTREILCRLWDGNGKLLEGQGG